MAMKTGYCPLCDKTFVFHIDNSMGYCPECAHHLVLHDVENEKRKYKVITLCGSTRFKDEFLEVQKRLTLGGNVVLSVGLFGHSGDTEAFNGDTKTMLDDMHRQKIDMADEILVINVGGYIGDSTRAEIDYAQDTGKPVRYLYTCGTCDHFIGLGEWSLCCDLRHDDAPCGYLCYDNTPACNNHVPMEVHLTD